MFFVYQNDLVVVVTVSQFFYFILFCAFNRLLGQIDVKIDRRQEE